MYRWLRTILLHFTRNSADLAESLLTYRTTDLRSTGSCSYISAELIERPNSSWLSVTGSSEWPEWPGYSDDVKLQWQWQARWCDRRPDHCRTDGCCCCCRRRFTEMITIAWEPAPAPRDCCVSMERTDHPCTPLPRKRQKFSRVPWVPSDFQWLTNGINETLTHLTNRWLVT